MFGRKEKTPAKARLLASVIVFTLACNPLFCETRVYREKTGDREYVNIYSIDRSPQGSLISIQSRYREKVFLRKKVWVDEAFSTLKWKYHNLLDEMDLYAYRHGNRITLSGMSRGVSIERTYKIDGNPWKQQFPLDLEKFALSDKKLLNFWAIGTSEPAELKIAKFIARKRGRDSITVNGCTSAALRITVSLHGLLSLFWHGESWHRLLDGNYILFESTGVPGHPPTVMEMLGQSR